MRKIILFILICTTFIYCLVFLLSMYITSLMYTRLQGSWGSVDCAGMKYTFIGSEYTSTYGSGTFRIKLSPNRIIFENGDEYSFGFIMGGMMLDACTYQRMSPY